MTTDTAPPEAPPDGPSLLDLIGAAQQNLQDMRAEHARAELDAQRELAALIAATRDHPDPGVNPSAAARVMGVGKAWPYSMVKKWEAGEYDPPDDGQDGR